MGMIKVTKRNGKQEPVHLDKILDRIQQQTYGLDQKWIVPFEVAQKVIDGITPGVRTSILDQLAMETAASLATKHPDYSILAARIAITSLHKETKKSFSETVKDLYEYVNPKTQKHSPIVSKSFFETVQKYADDLDSAIIHSRDHNFDYFGYKTLEKSYLLKINGKVSERPQYMYMRTAIQIWGDNIEKVIQTYNDLSEGYYTHATPTLFNSGTNRPQLSSCFLLDTGDSIEDIFDTLKESAQISKNAGGIGISFTKVRAKGSYISGTNGTSNGIIPFLKIYNETARAVDQCFVSETNVITNNGYKKISDINVGDKVLTSDGRFNKVLERKKFDKKNIDLVVIKTNNGVNKVTKGHQLLVVRDIDKNDKNEDIKQWVKSGAKDIEWISAGDLLETDRIVKY
jgi:ribonucleotide reductase alpha subunit